MPALLPAAYCIYDNGPRLWWIILWSFSPLAAEAGWLLEECLSMVATTILRPASSLQPTCRSLDPCSASFFA